MLLRNCLEIMIPISSFYAKDAHTHTNGILSSFILIGYASAAATSEEGVRLHTRVAKLNCKSVI